MLSHIVEFSPATLELVLAALLLLVVVGFPLGVVAASSNGRWPDHLVRDFCLSGWVTPTCLGAVVLAVFVTVLAFSLLGGGRRDILDPRSRKALAGTGPPTGMAAVPETSE